MSASSPGPDDKSGITQIGTYPTSAVLYVQRTVSTITVFDHGWEVQFTLNNLGQSDALVAQSMEVYCLGRQEGRQEGREGYRQELLRLLGVQPAKEEG
jgi:hypothetical protein